jgi:hypothetical protein
MGGYSHLSLYLSYKRKSGAIFGQGPDQNLTGACLIFGQGCVRCSGRVVYRGRGQHRKRLVQAVALYTVRVQGTANSRGRFTRSLKITYQPRKRVQALLAASARIGRRTATRTTHVTIRPQRHQRKTHQR